MNLGSRDENETFEDAVVSAAAAPEEATIEDFILREFKGARRRLGPNGRNPRFL